MKGRYSMRTKPIAIELASPSPSAKTGVGTRSESSVGFSRHDSHFRISYAVTDRDVELAVDALKRVADRVAARS